MNWTPTRRTILSAAALATAGPALSIATGARSTQSSRPWPYARADPANTGSNPSVAGPETNIQTESVLEAEGLNETVLAVGETVYLGRGEVIAAHSLDDGSEQWTWDAAEISIGGGPVGHSGQLLFANVGGIESSVGFLDPANGDRQWLVRGQGNVTVTPTGEEVYVSEGSVLSSLEQFGADRWQRSFEHGIVGTAVEGERVYVSTQEAVVALSRADGAVQWRQPIQSRDEPVVSGDSVYVVGDTVTALDKSDGTERWRASGLPGTVTSRVAATTERVYVGAGEGDQTFFALDSETGNIEWGVGLGSTTVPSTEAATTRPVVTGNAVYVGSSQTIHGIDPNSGDFLWRSTRDSAVGPAVPTGGGLLVPTESRLLVMSEQEESTDDGQQSSDESTDDSGENTDVADSDTDTDSTDGDSTEQDNTESSDGSGPGFGLPAGLAALGGAGYLLNRRSGDLSEDVEKGE